MKKYLSCIILIVICIVCATVFYVNANDFLPSESSGESSSPSQSSSGTIDSSAGDNNLVPDSTPNAIIERQGTILSERLSSYGLRIEWAVYKLENSDDLYFSSELYLDSPDKITTVGEGYLSVNGEKKKFTAEPMVGTSNLLTTYSTSFAYEKSLCIEVESFLEIDISTEAGVELSSICASGSVIASEEHSNMPNSHLIELEHISQYPELPSGDEITSLAMVLKYLKYNVDKGELCDLYLEKGPVGYTSFFEANVGNPRNAYNSYGCLAPVIVNSANKYINVNGGNFKAQNISGVNTDALYYEVSQGNPVIVWACEDFDVAPSVSRIWVVDGQSLYLKSNIATMVLIGYNFEKNTVTLANPAGNVFEIDMDLFELRYSQIGSYAVLIK